VYIFGGDTSKQRNDRLKFYMDSAFQKINIQIPNNKNNKLLENNKKQILENKKKYSIVVGTFKYRKNAENQIKIIKSKYPITTNNKISEVVLVDVSGKKLYESRFINFTKKNAYQACKRLAKYGRDCFVRL